MSAHKPNIKKSSLKILTKRLAHTDHAKLYVINETILKNFSNQLDPQHHFNLLLFFSTEMTSCIVGMLSETAPFIFGILGFAALIFFFLNFYHLLSYKREKAIIKLLKAIKDSELTL